MIYCWLYVIINALSALLRQIGGSRFSPALMLLFGTIFAILYFHFINFSNIKKIYQYAWKDKIDWLNVSISVAIMWACAMYSPSYIDASLYTLLFFSTLGIIGMFGLYESKLPETISLLGLCSILGYVLYVNIKHDTNPHNLLGIELAILGGISAFIYTKQSYNFIKKASLTSTQILAIRFYPTLILSLLLTPQEAAHYSLMNVSLATFIGIFCFIIPLYFSQKGIEKTGPLISSVIFSFTPFITAIFEEFYYRNMHWHQFMISAFYSMFAILPIVAKKRKDIK